MKRFYDKHKGPAINYEPGNLVWLDGRNLKTERPMKKLEDRRFGPFKVIRRVGASAFQLELPATWKAKRIKDVFNESLLKPYIAPSFPSQIVPPPPPPELIDEEEHYEVEQILKSEYKKVGRKNFLRFLVKWKGYSNEHNS